MRLCWGWDLRRLLTGGWEHAPKREGGGAARTWISGQKNRTSSGNHDMFQIWDGGSLLGHIWLVGPAGWLDRKSDGVERGHDDDQHNLLLAFPRKGIGHRAVGGILFSEPASCFGAKPPLFVLSAAFWLSSAPPPFPSFHALPCCSYPRPLYSRKKEGGFAF